MEKILSDQEKVRRQKLDEISKVCNPYPDHFTRTHTIKEARELADGTKDVSVAGRMVFARKMGKLSFAKIRDLEGDIQLEFRVDVVGEEKYSFFKKLIDTGDFIGATGEIFTTQTGEKTLRVSDFEFLGKALRPLPEKYHGLADTEIKYRQRYVDLITSEESRRVFLGRSKFYHFLHSYLDSHGFLEVETPIMQTAVSGASAKPFFTHHNALDLDMNLRIAPECYLKECIAGGYDRVYEVAKCFRNEGMDTEHLQEFTQVEWYCAYWRYEDNIVFFENFIREALKYLTGSTTVTYRGNTLDFGKEWPRINYVEEMNKILGDDFLSLKNPEDLKKRVVDKGLFTMQELDDYKSISQIIDFVYKKKIRANIINPTIIYNYPASLKPLARRNDKDKDVVDVFQVIVAGSEICNAYSELVNPEVQRANFEEQLRNKALGDDETMDLDEDYLSAMEQGMPPISGLGFGIDRLIMIAFDAPSIRDVVLFPTMKPTNAPKKVNNVSTSEESKSKYSLIKKTDFSKVKVEPLFKDFVDFDNFSACDFRAVKVLDCKKVPKSKKLLEFTLNDGSGQDRTILSGISAYYEPEELIGKTLVAITNLPPKKMMGIESNGMLISAVHEEDDEERLHLIIIDDEIPAGAKLC